MGCHLWGRTELDTTERLHFTMATEGILGGTQNCPEMQIRRERFLTRIGKSEKTTLATKVHLVKAMVFPVVIYGCKSWTIKKLSAEELMLLNYGVGEVS